MSHCKLVLFLGFNFFLCFAISAQDEGEVKKKNTSKTITIEEDETENEENNNLDNYSGHQNVVKFQVLDLIKGYSLITYTRALKEDLAVDFSIGRNFSPHLLGVIFDFPSGFERGIPNESPYYFPLAENSDFSRFTFSPGFILRLGMKYFYNPDYQNDGSYLGFEFGNIAHKYKVFDDSRFLNTRITDLRLYWGRQSPFGSSNLYYDINLSAGVGFRKSEYVYYDYIPQTFNEIDINNPRYLDGKTYDVIRFSFGFALGYGF
jgi:hypothetical protein